MCCSLRVLVRLLVSSTLLGAALLGQRPAGWPEEVAEVRIPRGEGAPEQPAMWWAPAAAATSSTEAKPVPLVVVLHTWSGDWRQTDPGAQAARACMARGWAFLHPDFGGPNRTPEACGSERMVQDVLDAVDWAGERTPIDTERVFLFGGSGGGHAALLMAARAPERWAAVSAWVPIVDLAQWHRECSERSRYARYARDVEKACGGSPGTSPEVDREFARRSPLPTLARARGVAIDLHAGLRDGHEGSVPIHHVLQAFDALADPEQRIGEELRERLVALGAAPPEEVAAELSDSGATDSKRRWESYGTRRPLWRRASHNARVTLFDGGHEILVDVAFEWLDDVAREAR